MCIILTYQGCALAEAGGPWHLTFALGRLENLRFFIQIICWAPWILQFQSTGLPSIFLRAQPCLSHNYKHCFQVCFLKYATVTKCAPLPQTDMT